MDPLTGLPYLAEAQQYGSVQAAEKRVAGESLSTTRSGLGTGGGRRGRLPAGAGPGERGAGHQYASNAAWAQAAEAGLTDIGYTRPTWRRRRPVPGRAVETPRRRRSSGGIAEYGPPPVGSFQVIMAPPGPEAAPEGTARRRRRAPSTAAPSGLHVTTCTRAAQVRLERAAHPGRAGAGYRVRLSECDDNRPATRNGPFTVSSRQSATSAASSPRPNTTATSGVRPGHARAARTRPYSFTTT